MTHEPGEGPPDVVAARARVKAMHDKPQHKYRPDHTGKDPRDEQTRNDPLPEDTK